MFNLFTRLKTAIDFYILKRRFPAKADYYQAQLNRTKMKFKQNSPRTLNRKEYLIGLLKKHIDLSKIDYALVVGCRDTIELDELEQGGVKKVVGIDLMSFDNRVKIMDMHNMTFTDNTFDLIYCSHVLEHSYNPKLLFQNISRVIKNNGVLIAEVPVNYETNNVDIQDYKSAEDLIEMINSVSQIELINKENLKVGEPNNFEGLDIARIVVKFIK